MTQTTGFQSQNGLILTLSETDSVYSVQEFQSQNGLILTPILLMCSPKLVTFQSQNGLILTYSMTSLKSLGEIISIPKWSDFNLTIMLYLFHRSLDFNPKMV